MVISLSWESSQCRQYVCLQKFGSNRISYYENEWKQKKRQENLSKGDFLKRFLKFITTGNSKQGLETQVRWDIRVPFPDPLETSPKLPEMSTGEGGGKGKEKIVEIEFNFWTI